MNQWHRIGGLILAFVLGGGAWSQGVTAVISGIVNSPKAAIGAASVTITDTDTGVVAWDGKTNGDGVYRAPNLPAGRYDIDVAAEGFKHQLMSGVELAVGERADIVIQMQAGESVERVTVEGR